VHALIPLQLWDLRNVSAPQSCMTWGMIMRGLLLRGTSRGKESPGESNLVAL
jgi:hypothetical protein